MTVYAQLEGGPRMREGGRRVLRADSTGLILTAFLPTYGRVDIVYVSETGGLGTGG